MIRSLRTWGLLLVFAIHSSGAELPKIKIAPDGKHFQTADGRPYIPFGVTYYRPGTGWAPQVWKQFDADATRKDFALMKKAGVNCARVFISYGSFCMKPDSLDTNGLAKFDQFLAIAEDAGIYVHPTGPDHWEGLADWASVDRIADEQNLVALESFWKQFAARYRDRSVIFAYDLRNEPEVAWDSPVMRAKWKKQIPDPKKASAEEILEYQKFRESIADEWTRRQVNAIKAADPKALVTVGMIQWSVPSLLPGIQHYSGFRPERQAPMLDFLEVHFYPFANGAFEYASAEDEARNLAYLESVVAETARPGKPVVVAEFGWYGGGKPRFDNDKHPFATEDQQAHYCRGVVESTAGFATGWLNWGFYDQPEATDCSQFTGLYTADGKEKAWGRAFLELASKPVTVPKRSPRPQLNWDRALVSTAEANAFRAEYHRAVTNDLAAPVPANKRR